MRVQTRAKCAECGQNTHEETSALFVDYFTGKGSRRVCFDCCPPDDEETDDE